MPPWKVCFVNGIIYHAHDHCRDIDHESAMPFDNIIVNANIVLHPDQRLDDYFPLGLGLSVEHHR